jgi:hypothetical protein
VEGRSLSAMALFITVSMPADGRAHRDEREGATIFISMLQQLPHHRRIICTRKYTMARTCKPRLICLWPSAATITTMTTRRTPAASNVGQGCVTTGVCHGTRGDTIRSDQTDSALGEDLFPACFAPRSTVHTTTPVSPPSARVGSTALHCTARQKRRRVCCRCQLSIAVGARHDLPTDCLPDCGCHAVCPCPAALLLTCPIRAVSFILQGRG